MAQSTTFYFVEKIPGFKADGSPKEIKEGEKKQYEPRLVADLRQLYSQKGQGWKSLEAFTEDVVDNAAIGRALGYTVRKATEQEVADEPSLAVHEPLKRFDNAEVEMNRIQHEALLEIVKWLDNNVKSGDDLTSFYKTHTRDSRQVKAWANRVSSEYRLSNEFLKIYGEHTEANRSASAKNKDSAKKIAEDFYPKDKVDADK